jgi:signal transduction histidine kinase
LAGIPNQNDQVDQQWLELIAHQSARVPFPVGLVMLALGQIAALHISPAIVLPWLAAVFLVLVLRYIFLRRLPQQTHLPFRRKLVLVVGLSAINGSVHALSLLVFPYISDHEKLFFTLLLLALCTGATSTTAGHRMTFFAYFLPIVGMLIFAWANNVDGNNHTWTDKALPFLIGFYGLTLIGVAKATNKIFVESCQIREKEHDLNQQLQQALAQAQEANHAKTRFLAAASHDLRQPLHTQSMLVATLSLRKLDPRSTEIVRMLMESNDTLAKLLDGLLDISKLDAGIVELNKQQFLIQPLVLQHFAQIEGSIRAKNLLPVLLCECDAVVETDPQLFLRILRNLADNAIKFTEHGQIRLEVRSDAHFVDVCVSDTGPGIPEACFDKIFQEFYQIENPERDRTKGLGLGLSIVKRLTDLLGIELRFTSSLQTGTEFHLRLPIVSNPAIAAPDAMQPGHKGGQFALLVLIVDDEENVRTSVRILLEELGCRCMEADSSAAAVAALEQAVPDFILADFRLRGDDSGIRTISAIRQRCPGLPAVLVSGDTAPDRQREAHNAGIRLLHKPLSLQQLQQELSSVKQSF